MSRTIKPYQFILMIILLGMVFLLPFLGSVNLLDWDELIFAESAREMMISGDYLTVSINFEPFFEKPPLFIWMQVASMKLFGINEFAARFPNVICGILTLIVLFLIGKKLHGSRFGMLWVMSYASALLPFFYFRTGLIDPWFNLFIFLGIYFIVLYLDPEEQKIRRRNIALSALFTGLAILTKGPVAFLLIAIGGLTYLFLRRGKVKIHWMDVLIYVAVLLVVGGSWFIASILNGNLQVIKDFIAYQADLFASDFAGHSGFPGFHLVIILLGVFPASVLALGAITRKQEDTSLRRDFRLWMTIILVLVLVIFSIVETKLVNYSSLAYFPVTFLAAREMDMWLGRQREIWKWQVWLLGAVSFLLSGMVILTVTQFTFPVYMQEHFPAIASFFNRHVPVGKSWGILYYLPAILLFPGILPALRFIYRRDARGIFLLHILAFIFINSAIYMYAPRIEKQMQGAAIEFFKEHSGPDQVVATLGYRSFAQYFYGERMPGELDQQAKSSWFTKSGPQKPIYVVIKAENAGKVFARFPELQRIGESHGYVFGLYEHEAKD